MQTKHPCVLSHIGTKGEISTIQPSRIFFTDRSKVVLLLWIIFVIYASCLSCFLVFSLQPWDHLLGKGWPLGSLVIPDLCLLTYFT